MRYNPLQNLAGTIKSVKLAVSAASDYRERTERRRARVSGRV
ncbi:hypothetical protein ABID16_001544 [Rhizobium aquaticum]|uniref:Uncharacterized protein n=1 Tax=Rhizobium aquaticum TaxID=1549636 RepID=A0ABV2J001_9HYPH